MLAIEYTKGFLEEISGFNQLSSFLVTGSQSVERIGGVVMVTEVLGAELDGFCEKFDCVL